MLKSTFSIKYGHYLLCGLYYAIIANFYLKGFKS